jgi:hypothetical protein
MTQNLFLDKAAPPTNAQVARALGPRAVYLAELKRCIPAPASEQWKFYGKTIGWTLKLLTGKRNLCFIVIRKGYFTIAFVLGNKAVQEVERSALPSAVVQELKTARRYVEGRGIRFEVRSRRALGHAKILLAIKAPVT